MNPSRHRTKAAAFLIGAAFWTSALAGCGGSDTDAALEEATITLNALGASGSVPLAATNDRKAKYQAVIAKLKSVDDDASGAAAAAAQLLLARAHAGLAEMSAGETAAAESAWLDRTTLARLTFDRALSQRAVSQALASFDPTKELADLDEQIRQREQEAAEARQAQQTQQQLVDKINADAAAATAKAEAERVREAEIRAGMQGASETQRAAILEQAREVKRRGDEFEKQAANLAAEAAKEAPEIASIQAQIDKLNRQVELLRVAKQALRARAEASQAQAAEAAREARQTDDEVTALLAAVRQSGEEAATLTEQTIQIYRTAIAAANKAAGTGASNELKANANIARGNYHQSVGDVLAAHARGQLANAQLLSALAAGSQPGVTAAQAAEARAAFDQTRSAAYQAYTEAADLFSRASATGDLKTRLESLSERMRKLNEALAPAASPDAPADAPAEPDAPPADDAPADQPETTGHAPFLDRV